MVQPETASWLNESRGSFGAAQSRFNDVSSMDGTGAGARFMSAEYAVKAVIVEHYGFLPPSFKTHHRIVNLSHLIGLWWQLPPDLRAHLAEMAPLDPNVLYPRETRLPRYPPRSEEHTSELQSHSDLVCRLLLEKKKQAKHPHELNTTYRPT